MSDGERYASEVPSAGRYRALLLVVALCLLKFAAYMVIAFNIGGDAVNGKTVAGRFYLAEKGRYTEVSQAVYTYSLWHTYSLLVTGIIFLPAMLMVRLEQDRRRREAVKEQIKKGGYPHWPTT